MLRRTGVLVDVPVYSHELSVRGPRPPLPEPFARVAERMEANFPRPPGFKTLWLAKSVYLLRGDLPCLPHWHCDIVRDGQGLEAEHYLWQRGAGSATEFKSSEAETLYLAPWWIYSYGPTDWHRPSPAQYTGWRNLIRLTYYKIDKHP